MCVKEQNIDMDYLDIMFSSNEIHKSSLWLNLDYFKWLGKYCHDVVAFFTIS
jgi:hypothetical protein